MPVASWVPTMRDAQVGSALCRMHEDPVRPWTVAKLAQRGGVSRATLSRRFTGLAGEPPLAYRTPWRQELAGRRLRDANEALPVVTGGVGYTSVSEAPRAPAEAGQGAHEDRAHCEAARQPGTSTAARWPRRHFATRTHAGTPSGGAGTPGLPQPGPDHGFTPRPASAGRPAVRLPKAPHGHASSVPVEPRDARRAQERVRS
jgi:AraC-like DNA-binding protein